MKCTLVITLTFLVVLCSSETQNPNGNPTGEIGSPAFDEIVVESTLTVRGKSGSKRSGKALVNKPADNVKTEEVPAVKVEEASVILKRNKRRPVSRYPDPRYPSYRPPKFPSSSSSSASSSAQAYNSQTPFGNFGASASQSNSQSFNLGPGGIQGSAGNSASQTYNLPNGNQIDVSFSNGYTVNNGKPSFSQSHAVTVTRPDGQKQVLNG